MNTAPLIAGTPNLSRFSASRTFCARSARSCTRSIDAPARYSSQVARIALEGRGAELQIDPVE